MSYRKQGKSAMQRANEQIREAVQTGGKNSNTDANENTPLMPREPEEEVRAAWDAGTNRQSIDLKTYIPPVVVPF